MKTVADRMKICTIYQSAKERPPHERGPFLTKACGGNAALREYIEEQLAEDEESSLDDSPAQAVAQTLPGASGDTQVQAAVLTAVATVRFQPILCHARGGSGEVLAARDQLLPRKVALKRLKATHADDPECRRRFLREAEITSMLDHPGVPPVYALAQTPDDRLCYAMRFLHGKTLQEAIGQFHKAEDQGRDPKARTCELRQLVQRLVAACHTIAYAHHRGILHRDIKPSNILLGRHGDTYVVDWGLARHFDQAHGVHPDTPRAEPAKTPPCGKGEDVEATPSGLGLGTVGYRSPEQAAGHWRLLGPATDVYGLGATLYSLLTGSRPVQPARRDGIDLPASVRAWAPPALVAICAQAMARAPWRRYSKVADLIADLENWMADEPVRALPETWTSPLRRWVRRHPTWMAGGVSALVTCAILLAGKLVFG